jgi:hypothetical protein
MKLIALPLTIAVAFSTAVLAEQKPKISVRANPTMGMSPVRVVVTADLTGVSNATDDYYCPAVEWEWGDDTRSTNQADCDPFEAGKTDIKTHFTADHTYQSAGEFRVQFRLKKKDKTIGAGSTSVRVRPGLGDGGGDRERFGTGTNSS